MKSSLETPYHRFALIAELAQLCVARGRSLGRTALQKYMYLLQEIFKVDCGYDFQLYTYGPFCSELLSDLDFATTAQIVEVNHSPYGYGGYEIKPGHGFEMAKTHSQNFLRENEDQIKELFANFGDFSAKELELRATIIYSDRDCRASGKQISHSDFTSIIHEIKPGFQMWEIEAAIQELAKKDFILQRQ